MAKRLEWEWTGTRTRQGGEGGAAQAYLADKKQPPSLGPPYDPGYSPAVVSQSFLEETLKI